MNKKDIYKRALKVFGKQNQITMVFEETAELQKELSKHLRGEDNIDHIAEEIADVEIMLEQMKILFDIEDRVGQYKGEKINRLNDRINEYIFRRRTMKAPTIESPIESLIAPIKYEPKNRPVVDMGIKVDMEEMKKSLSSGNTVNDLMEEANEKLLKAINKNLSKLGTMSGRSLGR